MGISQHARMWVRCNSVRLWQRTRALLGNWQRQVARGQGLVEYALVLVLIAVVVIGVLSQLGGRTSQVFSQVNCALGSGGVAQSDSSHPGNPQGSGGGINNNTTTTTSGGC